MPHRKSILCWSRDLCLYFFRLPIDGCIGRRFFQSPAHVNLLKEMKRRLTEVADFHHAASKALRVPAEGSEGPPASQAGTPGYLTSPELHTELVRWAWLFSHLCCWQLGVLCWSSCWCCRLPDVILSAMLDWMRRVVWARFASCNASFLCSSWEGNWQFEYSSVKCLESEWKVLNQRADVLFCFSV